MMAAKPEQVVKVRDLLMYWDDQDARYWALRDVLEAYDNLCEAERRMDYLFGRDSLHKLLSKTIDE